MEKMAFFSSVSEDRTFFPYRACLFCFVLGTIAP
eukprot:CCRYP_019123-RA/>CCRYP_019123-RA protein AED:0.48 eAED:0.48 QI:2/1/1/1/0/0/2/117/33